MDSNRFAALARTIAAATSRRGVFAGLAGGLAALMALAGNSDDMPAKGKKCKGNQKKCGGKCIPKSHCCSNGECKGGKKCQSGKCKCPTGKKECSGTCIPEGACCTGADCDPCETCDNGVCSAGCAAGQECVGGECLCTPEECSGCCAGDESCGSGNDPAACGSDGEQCIACGDNETCPAGTCVCEAPFMECPGGCVDVDTDPDNCGGCSKECSAGAQCVEGECLVTITPQQLQGWTFWNDQDDIAISPAIVEGPETPPVGAGSASLVAPNSSAGTLVSARDFLGVRIDNLETLHYSTYVTSAEFDTAPSLQLGVSRTGTAQAAYGGRLVFVPSLSATQDVSEGEWQTWNVLAPDHGDAWFLTKDFNDASNNTCRLGIENCTLAEILSHFPNISINPIANPVGNAGAGWGIIGAKVGSGEGAVNANVDAFTLKREGDTQPIHVFSFETNAEVLRRSASRRGRGQSRAGGKNRERSKQRRGKGRGNVRGKK